MHMLVFVCSCARTNIGDLAINVQQQITKKLI